MMFKNILTVVAVICLNFTQNNLHKKFTRFILFRPIASNWFVDDTLITLRLAQPEKAALPIPVTGFPLMAAGM
jgi:hypothetical protein